MGSAAEGYHVVVEELAGLAKHFHDSADMTLRDVAAPISELRLTGEQTGRCCRAAGDSVQKALDTLGANVRQFSVQLRDTASALDATVREYQAADEYVAGRIQSAGGRD